VPRVVYSHLLAWHVGAPFGDTLLGGPDGAVKWVVKDIVVVYFGGGAVPQPGFSVLDSHGAPVMAIQQPWSTRGVEYHWTGSQVVETADSLLFRADSAGWSIRVSGYILTLP
jgi:hypothetical protein